MDFFDLAKLMLRWRYVTVPLIVLTFVAAFTVSARAQPEFTAQGSLMLVGPTTSETTDGEVATANPLLSQNGALPTTAYVTALAATSPQVRTLLGGEGLSTTYDVAAESRLPIVLLEVRAPTREMATNTALRLVELIDEDLRLRQDAADIPNDQRVTADVIGISSAGGADYGGRTRLRIVIILFGLVATIGVAFGLEALRRHRRDRDEPNAGTDGDSDPPEPANEPTIEPEPVSRRQDFSPPKRRQSTRSDGREPAARR